MTRNKTKVEIEKLFESVKQLESKDKVNIANEELLKCELQRFGLRERKDYSKDLITKEEHGEIKRFKENTNITIRKSDKSNIFVILEKSNYDEKLSSIISDTSKFKKITKDPTDEIKTKINREIEKKLCSK